MDMEEIIADKVKEGIQAYVESLGINIDASLKSEQVPYNPLEDCQQPSSLVPGVHTRKFALRFVVDSLPLVCAPTILNLSLMDELIVLVLLYGLMRSGSRISRVFLRVSV
ncbi:hypothetical protein H5410_051010 [Solanum commersonii]|uniref:Uncharacterized protein n=1 Tax=Solanum commersonii TaxID=4109 RepID=A0A9J5WYD7_SOLCO|nr:hypothetical protein H5410_051010 [Solanum commersonii]